MNPEKLAEYLDEQHRTIKSIDGKLLFWKNKDDGYDIEINGRMKITSDRYVITDDGSLSFQIKGKTVFETGTNIEDLTIYDEIIGRVFQFKGGYTWFFAFAEHFDLYDCMRWDDDGDSEYCRYSGEEIHRMWSENEIVGLPDADSSAEKILEFMRVKVAEI